MSHVFDVLILGSGAAGLTAALKLAEHGSVAIVIEEQVVLWVGKVKKGEV